jgi:phi LC3 family holin
MKINWKVRFKNPVFLFQLFLAVAVPIGAYFGLTGQDITTWGILINVILDALSNPYVLFLIGVSVFNALTDPVVRGLSDSSQALRYERPKDSGI